MQLNVAKITIIKGNSTDYVYLVTDLPPADRPFEGNADILLHCAYDTAEEYCKKNFPDVSVEVFNMRPGEVVKKR